VLLGVSGGIAAYKACTLVRLLRESGHEVRVVPTEAALKFVGAPTWEALSGHPVSTSVWDDVATVGHVELGRWAELVVIAPATADVLARAAAGLADDLLTTSLLTTTAPVLMSPAMHTEMWQHAATQANVETLRSRGVSILEPASGRLTGSDTGPGRLPEPTEIMAAALALLTPGDLAGHHVVVSAGGTREPWDPVRYLSNRSSGRQGVALAERARDRGARVTLVAAHLEVPPPSDVDVVEVTTALDLQQVMLDLSEECSIVVMAAAVSDFRPADYRPAKIKKDAGEQVEIRLARNPDVLVELVRNRRPGQVIVGFAAETGSADSDVLSLGRMKLAGKGCDVLVVNDVSGNQVFGQPTNEVVILTASGLERSVSRTTKSAIADAVWDVVVPLVASAG
jgi:phosphopantothenoylcysteine decarboxylase / phosphopantothenate---cysteine ligase